MVTELTISNKIKQLRILSLQVLIMVAMGQLWYISSKAKNLIFMLYMILFTYEKKVEGDLNGYRINRSNI